MSNVSSLKLCHTLFDSKAFKGKGVASGALDEIGVSTLTVWRDMEELSRETGSIENAVLYLQVHRYGKSSARAIQSLRWRTRKLGGDSHTLWTDLQQVLSAMPISTQNYYSQVNERVREMNLVNCMNRDAAALLLAHLQGPKNNRRVRNEDWLAWINKFHSRHCRV